MVLPSLYVGIPAENCEIIYLPPLFARTWSSTEVPRKHMSRDISNNEYTKRRGGRRLTSSALFCLIPLLLQVLACLHLITPSPSSDR